MGIWRRERGVRPRNRSKGRIHRGTRDGGAVQRNSIEAPIAGGGKRSHDAAARGNMKRTVVINPKEVVVGQRIPS